MLFQILLNRVVGTSKTVPDPDLDIGWGGGGGLGVRVRVAVNQTLL